MLLTENQPVPRDWFPPMQGLDLLGLACGGGQQKSPRTLASTIALCPQRFNLRKGYAEGIHQRHDDRVATLVATGGDHIGV